jgi:hypothetical protein
VFATLANVLKSQTLPNGSQKERKRNKKNPNPHIHVLMAIFENT